MGPKIQTKSFTQNGWIFRYWKPGWGAQGPRGCRPEDNLIEKILQWTAKIQSFFLLDPITVENLWIVLGDLNSQHSSETTLIEGPHIQNLNHQTFQVPKMEVLTYIGCSCTAYVGEFPHPQKIAIW